MIVWTEELRLRAKNLLADGLSARQAGEVMNVSRNAIIGAMHRMKVRISSLRPPVVRVRRAGPSAYKRVRVTIVKDDLQVHRPKKPILEPGEHACNIIGLTRSKCHWPMWKEGEEPINRLYCGNPTDVYPYCAAHRAIGFRSIEPNLNGSRVRPLLRIGRR